MVEACLITAAGPATCACANNADKVGLSILKTLTVSTGSGKLRKE